MQLLEINWYQVFYWVTVADNVKTVTGYITVILGVYMLLACIAALGAFDETFNNWESGAKRVFYIFSIAFFFSLFTWMLVPSKRDAAVIIAGGAVGNFLVSDSSAKGIPAELTLLARERLKQEIEDIRNPLEVVKDTLEGKSVEELKAIIKNNNK